MIDSEKVWRIWDEFGDECLEVGEDPDGLGLVEIRLRDTDGKLSNSRRISMTAEMAMVVAEHMVDIAKWINSRSEMVVITVNGRRREVFHSKLSYDEILKEACEKPDPDLTVTFTNAKSPTNGSLSKGDCVYVKDGTVINCYRAGNS